jgi:hypothetical protein
LLDKRQKCGIIFLRLKPTRKDRQMINRNTAQQNIRRTGEMYATGKRGNMAYVSVQVYPPQAGSVIVATANPEHITEGQLLKALSKIWPADEYTWTARTEHGYIRADGKPTENKDTLDDLIAGLERACKLYDQIQVRKAELAQEDKA